MIAKLDEESITRKRQVAAVTVVIAVIGGAWIVLSQMSDSQIAFWFGRTVEHCPNMEISCPSQKPGAVLWILAPAVLLLILLEDDDE